MITNRPWYISEEGTIHLFRMENTSGAYIELTNYGAALAAVYVPNRAGKLGNVVLGFPDAAGYLNNLSYMGATIGRFANRIAGAKFELDGNTYLLEENDGFNTNHSGRAGFNTRLFDFSVENNTLIFSLLSKDGDGGFPGNLQLKVSYRWTENNELLIDYWAVSDQKTIANFTNHTYFNLSASLQKIFDHKLIIQAGSVVEAGADYIPTGLIVAANGLSFKGNSVEERVSVNSDGAIAGLNVCYVLDKRDWQKVPACVLTHEQSGRVMKVYTSYPGLLLYTGDFLSSTSLGHRGKVFEPFDGLCLECQYFPDSPNQPGFPSTVLPAGLAYQQSIQFKFSTT